MFRLSKIPHTSHLLLTLVILAGSTTGYASNGEVAEEIQVQANYMKFDIETGSSTYQGDVKISQGSIELSGDKVVILRQQDKIQQINIDGQPAQFIQDEHTENKIHARSQHMKYFASKNRLVMTVDAHLQQPDHTIESQRIVYDTKNKTVIAGNNKQNQQGGRVNIILTPKKDNPTPSTETP
ncbi:MAG: lipopolysaccharide transport periplasmic protein LptA [Gammaproteobacteria bacterium]|nr:lipopolysaccharide transport periplasmic protein LptA [Gammaproteobacteria bacterium]MCW8923365.1 lipopolysaccharide transport periplasmic protein LptA [Gammaproteobacteria bacterium]